MATDPKKEISGRLIGHFSARKPEVGDQNAGWASLWDSDESCLWDRGKPSPALTDLVETRSDLLTPVNEPSGRRPRALVPGCGTGYDVVMLALHGYDAYGLDFSPKAVEMARANAEKELADPKEYNFSDAAHRDQYLQRKPGQVKFVSGDFFGKDWESDCCSSDDSDFGGFDLISDYTFMVALLPELRKDWARRMSELLSPSGVLVCLEFPTYKDLKHPGPPWGVREGVYWDLLAAGGGGIFENEQEAQKATKTTKMGAFERIAYIKPPRTFEIAKGTDMLSLWRLRK